MLGFGAMLAAFALFLLWFYPSRMSEAAARMETARASSVAGALAKAASSALSFNDELAVSELLSALAKDPEARFAEVRRGDGTTLAQWKVEKNKKWPKLTEREQQWVEGDTLVVAAPIVSTLGGQGHLILGLSRRAFALEVEAIRTVTFGAAALVLVFGALIAWIMGGVLARPTQVLSAFTARVLADRDLRVTLPPLSRDEIGELGKAFSSLLDAQRTTLRALAASLEEHERLGETLAKVGRRVQDGTDAIGSNVSDALVVSQAMFSGLEGVSSATRSLSGEVASTQRASADVVKLAQGVSNRLRALGEDAQLSSNELQSIVVTIGQTSRAIADSETFVTGSAAVMSTLAESQASVQRAAKDAASLAHVVAKEAAEGAATIAGTVKSLAEIRGGASEATAAIARLTGRIEEVGEFLRVIDEVAERTNLLSLNASIVAAQAGEHGRAFMVVANEVNDLAERSRDYTKQIAATVTAIRTEANAAASATQKNDARVEAGVFRGNEAAAVFQRISNAAPASLTATGKIGKETEDQLRGVENMRTMLEDLTRTFSALREAGSKQSAATEIISSSGKKVLALASEALESAKDQRESLQTIEQALDRVGKVMGSLEHAQEAQMQQAERVRAVIDAISAAGASQREAIASLEKSVRALNEQSIELRRDLGRFAF
jgi:methyl-accepting chemotaxis protein